MSGTLNEDKKLYYYYDNKYYKIEIFKDLGINCLLESNNNIDYKISEAIKNKIRVLIDKKIENIENEVTSLMKEIIEIEVDFINRKDLTLIENIGLTQKICEEKIGGRCAYLIDNYFGCFYNNDFLSLQEEIKKYWGYNNFNHDDKHKYYYEWPYPSRYNSISLIEYYYMLFHFNIDFEKIHDVLNRNPHNKEDFFNDYKYIYLYKEIGGDNFNGI